MALLAPSGIATAAKYVRTCVHGTDVLRCAATVLAWER